jgi:REase_AHJR-like
MILRRGKEAVVVSVQSRSSLNSSSTQHLRNLAQAIEKQPGWRFELVMANSEDAAYALNPAYR